MGGPCPLGDSWLYNREDDEWTKLEDCSSPVNDGVMITVGHPSPAITPTNLLLDSIPRVTKL